MGAFNYLLEMFQPQILEIIGSVLALALLWLSGLARKWLGVQIEARHREALHSALMTGAAVALKNGSGAGRDYLIDQVIDYARASVPQAIKKLGPSEFVLRKLAERYADQLLDRIKPKLHF